MMRYLTILLLILFLLPLSTKAQSYVGISLDRDSITPGDPFTVELTLSLEDDLQGSLLFNPWNKITNLLYEQDTVNFAEFADFAILNSEAIPIKEANVSLPLDQLSYSENNGKQIFQDRIQMTIYDLGVFYIPTPELKINGSVLPTQGEQIVVALPPELQRAIQDSIGVAPIKPIIEEPMTLEDFTYLFVALGIILLFGLLYYLLKKNKKEEAPVLQEVIIRPAHIIALEKLHDLKKEQLWQQGKIKAYQSQLTYIIREYLENRYHFSALEMTTGEILQNLPSEVNKSNLQKILQIADLVKFAKANPPEDLHSQFLDLAYDIVQTTKIKVEIADD